MSPAFAKLTENWVNCFSNKTRPVLLHTVYSRLADTLLLTDTPLMRTRASPPPPGEMHKEMTVTNSDPAITNSRYYGNADTFLPPSARFHLVFSLAIADTWILRQKSGLIGWCDILYQLISRGKRLVFYLSRRDCHVITVSGCLILTAVNSSWYGWLTKC